MAKDDLDIFDDDELDDNLPIDADGEEDEDLDFDGGINKNKILMIVAIVFVVISLLVVATVVLTKNNGKQDKKVNAPIDVTDEQYYLEEENTINIGKDTTSTPIATTQESDGTLVTSDNNKIVPGMLDFSQGSLTVSPTVFDGTEFISDLNGNPISSVYTVDNITYEDVFVNYEKRRAILDNGMEMFWLEIDYENKRYRCQVPFYIYKALKDKGICATQVEILHMEDGSMVISYMTVNPNYLSMFE